jgi:hypothetical protein
MKLSRSPWQRILLIHARVQAGEFSSFVAMAKDWEVSHKTVRRDVGFMGDNLDLPFEYDPLRHGYFIPRRWINFRVCRSLNRKCSRCWWRAKRLRNIVPKTFGDGV